MSIVEIIIENTTQCLYENNSLFLLLLNFFLDQKPGYEDGLTKVKVKVVDEVKMEGNSFNKYYCEMLKFKGNCLASNPTAKDAVRSLSGILLAESDLSSSSDESSNNDKKEQGISYFPVQ